MAVIWNRSALSAKVGRCIICAMPPHPTTPTLSGGIVIEQGGAAPRPLELRRMAYRHHRWTGPQKGPSQAHLLTQVGSPTPGRGERLGGEPAVLVRHHVLLDDEPAVVAARAQRLHHAGEVHDPFAERAEDAAPPGLRHRDVRAAHTGQLARADVLEVDVA